MRNPDGMRHYSEDRFDAARKTSGGLCGVCSQSRLRLNRSGVCSKCIAKHGESVKPGKPAPPILKPSDWTCECCGVRVKPGSLRCAQHPSYIPPKDPGHLR